MNKISRKFVIALATMTLALAPLSVAASASGRAVQGGATCLALGAPGNVIQVSASGLPANTSVLVGQPKTDYVFVTTTASGTIVRDESLPQPTSGLKNFKVEIVQNDVILAECPVI